MTQRPGGSSYLETVEEDEPVADHSHVQWDRSISVPEDPSCLQRCSNWIIYFLETVFYKLGLLVAHHPWLTILISLVVCGACGIGLHKFEQTTDDAKLWVPKTSRVLPEKLWMDTNFPEKTRFTSFIIKAPNILSPAIMNAMFDMYQQAQQYKLPGDLKLDTMCIKVGSKCHVSGLLELWGYEERAIRRLTLQDILEKVNARVKYSPAYGTDMNIEYLLGGITRDSEGKIIGARAVTMTWVLHKKAEFEEAALEWERQMINLANTHRQYIQRTYVYATRTFDDEGYGAVNADVKLLTAGFIMVFIFVIMVLGRVNMVENKLYLSLIGIGNIGLALMFCYGLAMAFGFIYGPIHSLMPFLLLGIGVDDMFVIIGAWNNLSDEERKLPMEERIALSLKHAGVSITVTSITDIVAFGIGGSTVIPALSAFCAYASLGILGLYLLVSTFFIACLTLDQRRIEQNRNSVLFCYVHKNYTPNRFSQMDLVPYFIEKFYAPMLMKFPVKILVIIITIAVTGVNIWSFSKLRQDFDLYDYLPRDSYATDFIHIQQKFYPDRGYEAAVYCDGMDYFENRHVLDKMWADLKNDPYIQNGSINFWFTAYMEYFRTSQDQYIVSSRGSDGYPVSGSVFNSRLLYYLQQREGRSYGQYIKLDNSTPPSIEASYFPFIHTRMLSSAGDITAMESVQRILDGTPFINGHCFSYGFKYLNNETNKILRGELYRNLLLAGVCVFFVTLLLIANLWTSILVFTCVAFTVIDVVGALQFLGVTVDTASSILIILCVGLAVDYSAHVGHMFMTLTGNREVRAKKTLISIGPAVLNGGLSTFLAFVLLADSKSFGFVLFFRVFMMVVLFGLFHGLVYLPVILTWMGPEPYNTALTSERGTTHNDSSEMKEMLPNTNHTSNKQENGISPEGID